MPVLRVRIIGPGRVGLALAAALRHAGHDVVGVLGRDDDVAGAAAEVDLLVVTTPDDRLAEVAASVTPNEHAVVAHCSGAHGLDVLHPHPRIGSFHPLAAIPDVTVGFERLTGGASFAIDGDALVEAVVADLGGRAFRVAPADRVRYHAAAVIASNHLVALFGQVERIAAEIGIPVDGYLDLAQQTLDNVRRLGPANALTGPVARGDWATVYRHLLAVGPAERAAYEAMAEQANRLTNRSAPTIGNPTVGSHEAA
jgi:predicted short-subunit dehydrogenase-like oxidoreductase (DUF2520 family)